MIWPRTRRKLAEAKFFLEHIKDPACAHPIFDYYLSAFIGAARSVTWIMKAECTGVPGWNKWHEAKKPDPADEALLNKMNELRISSVKIKPLETQITITIGTSPAGKVVGLRREVKQFPDESVVAACERYYKFLSALVSEGETIFAVYNVPRSRGTRH